MSVFTRSSVKFKNIEIVQGGVQIGLGDVNTLGRKYFVTNITGSSTALGLSVYNGETFCAMVCSMV